MTPEGEAERLWQPRVAGVARPQAVAFCNIRRLRDMNLRNLAGGARHWQTILSPSEV